jgi:hypothetical protein
VNREQFREIYENYGERTYPKETADSVRRCYVPYENREQAYNDAIPVKRLTKQQASADVIDFFNCLKRTYCGYDYFFTDEKCDKIQETILRKIKSRLGKISNKTLALFLFRELSPILNDNHFHLYACRRMRLFQKNHNAYVTDIVLRKAGDIYVIVNENSDVPKGSFFTEDEVREFLLPTLYVGEGSTIEDEYYLLGKYSVTKVNFLSQQKLNDLKSFRHKGTVLTQGNVMDFSIDIQSNPDFTANILVSFAKCFTWLKSQNLYGAYSIFDLPLKALVENKFDYL